MGPKNQAAAPTWVNRLRQLIKATYGRGWILREHRGGRTQISRDFSDGRRSSVTVPIEWKPSSAPALLALVERLGETMEQHEVSLVRAAELINLVEAKGSAATIRDGAVDWSVVAERFRRYMVDETGTVAERTWHLSYRRHVAECLEVLEQRPAPRDGRSALEALLAAHPTPPGKTGRRQRLGNVARFLSYAVERCGAPSRYKPPANMQEVIGRRQERKEPATPLLDDQLLRLHRAVEDPQWRLALGLAGVFGLRPVELGCCRPEGGALRVQGVKRNSHGRSADRLVQPLDPTGAEGMGAELLAIFAEHGADALPHSTVAAIWSTRLQQHLVRHVPLWKELLVEAKATNQGHLTVYGLRHGYAFRGGQLYGLTPRVLASLMGHSTVVHLQHYGQWAGEGEVAAAVEAARERVAAARPVALPVA